MTDRVLVDTNILVYAYDADAGEKRSKARDVIYSLWNDGTGAVATQVLAEFFVTITRKVKHPLSVSSAKQIIEDYQAVWGGLPHNRFLSREGHQRRRVIPALVLGRYDLGFCGNQSRPYDL